MKARAIVIATAALFLALFFAASEHHRRARLAEATRLAHLHSAELLHPAAPTLGARDARVIIVEFFDPGCATCQAFYQPVKHLLAEHAGELRLVLRWAPFQLGSEQIVALIEAAARQDRLWEALDRLMETQDDWKPREEADLERALASLAPLGLDLARLRRDMADPAIAARIQEDEALAARLKIDTTPTFFVNGEPLPGFGFGILQRTIAAKLAAGP